MTFLGRHDALFAHDLPGHPETAARARALLDRAASSPALSGLSILEPDREATLDELARVHDRSVLRLLEDADLRAPVLLDPDTYVVKGSVSAARRTARLCMLAARRALQTGERGFVVARPPGHHATRGSSMGFCLVNNVAVAAADVLESRLAERVLVFDHDVHHGNGTEDVFWESDRVLFQSFHMAPHYPGTGDVAAIGKGAGEGFTMNAPLPWGAGDAEVRSLLLNVFLPAARTFQPDLVLVSAGFDSLVGDDLGGLSLSAPFYGEIVRRLIDVCPRVVCVLEGGYQVDRIADPFEAELLALDGREVLLGEEMRAPPSEPELLRALSRHWPGLGAGEERPL